MSFSPENHFKRVADDTSRGPIRSVTPLLLSNYFVRSTAAPRSASAFWKYLCQQTYLLAALKYDFIVEILDLTDTRVPSIE